MPVYTPNLTMRYIYTDFVNVMNARAFTTLNIYVNSVTGVDSGQGRGSSPTSAYKSLKFALNDAFTLLNKSQVVIHLAGADPHVLDDGFVFPEILSPDQITLDATPTFGFQQQAPLVLRATPTLVGTIAALAVVAQTDNANSGLKEIETTGGLVVNAFQGKWLLDANNVLARVISNDATDILIDYAGVDLTAPFQIYGEGATISPAVPLSGNPTVVLRGGAAPVVFFGIEVEASSGGAVQVGPGQQASFISCLIPSLELGASRNSNLTGLASVEAIACDLQSFKLPSGNLNLAYSAVRGGTISNVSSQSRVVATACSFQEMDSALFSDGENSPGFSSLINCLISESSSNGVSQIGGQLNMVTCDVADSAGAGVIGTRGAQLNLETVTSSTINAGVGLVLKTGTVANVDSNTVITGNSGELVVGNNSAITFANFRAGDTPFSFLAQDGSACIEGLVGQAFSPRYSVTTIAVVDSPYSVLNSDVFINANAAGGAITVNLPTAASGIGREITVKKIDAVANTVTVEADGAETIDGAANVALAAQWDVVTVVSNGTAWFIKSSVIA